MLRYLFASLIALGLHCAAAFFAARYSRSLVTIGGWFLHGNDIADLAKLWLGGSLLVGGLLVLVAIGVAYGTRVKTP